LSRWEDTDGAKVVATEEFWNLKGEDLNLTVCEMSQEHGVIIAKDENGVHADEVNSKS
jgi:hypothetical protein